MSDLAASGCVVPRAGGSAWSRAPQCLLHEAGICDERNPSRPLPGGPDVLLLVVACTCGKVVGALPNSYATPECMVFSVQVGVHGAGLINAFFMRPGSAMVEIFPCRFPADWASHYFWRPALVEKQVMPFQIHMQDEARCQPSQLEKNPGGLSLMKS